MAQLQFDSQAKWSLPFFFSRGTGLLATLNAAYSIFAARQFSDFRWKRDMLTLRRGIARAGWVLFALWGGMWAVIVVTGRSQSPNPSPIDAALALQLGAFVFGWPLAIFLLWRLLLWIGQGFWQREAAAPSAPEFSVFRPARDGPPRAHRHENRGARA